MTAVPMPLRGVGIPSTADQVLLATSYASLVLTLVDRPMMNVDPMRPPGDRAARFDLTVQLSELRDSAAAPAGMDGNIHYAADLFDEVTARAMAGRLVRVLRPVVECFVLAVLDPRHDLALGRAV